MSENWFLIKVVSCVCIIYYKALHWLVPHIDYQLIYVSLFRPLLWMNKVWLIEHDKVWGWSAGPPPLSCQDQWLWSVYRRWAQLWVESGWCRASWLTADIIMWPAAGRSDPNRHTSTVHRNSEVVLIHTQVHTDGDKHDGSVLTVSLDLFCPSVRTRTAGPFWTLCRWGRAHEAVRTDPDSRLMWVCEWFCQ